VRRAREGGTIHSVWETLSEPWRACVDLAWEAYRADSLPIGAVVADAEGRVLAVGRNRIHERSGPAGIVFGHDLAHAELNALLSFDHDANDPRACVLYTTTEPCPLCAGAMRMTDVGELRYASREPWAGSAAMFETVPYLRTRNVRVLGPKDRRLEVILVTLQVERFLRLKPEILEGFLRLYGEVMPAATRVGKGVYRSGLLRAMSEDGAPSPAVVRALDKEISSEM
jgi:tRNA(adenine34) deaminase